jgi:hypothetical protein
MSAEPRLLAKRASAHGDALEHHFDLIAGWGRPLLTMSPEAAIQIPTSRKQPLRQPAAVYSQSQPRQGSGLHSILCYATLFSAADENVTRKQNNE